MDSPQMVPGGIKWSVDNSLPAKSARQALMTAVISLGDERILRDCIGNRDCDVTETFSQERECYSALFMAVDRGWAGGIRILVEAGASINVVLQTHECKFLGTRRLVTPLTAAIEGYHNECVETLVSSGADVNFQNTYDKTTPVYLAVHTNQPDVVKYLLQHGADSNVFTTNEHATPLAVALANMAFRFDDAPRTPYIMVDQGQRRQEKALDIIEMLLQHGADMKACQWGRLPPPFLCATKDDTRVMELFLTYGLDVNMAAHPVDCCTPANSAGMWFAAVNDFDHPRRTWNMNEERRILTYYLEAGYYHVAVMLVAAGSDVTDIDRSIIKLNFIGSKGSRGERPSSIASQEDTFYLEALYLYQKAPPPLKIVCRKVIRKTMQVTTDERVKRLPVPKAVQMFLISQGLCF